MVDVVAAQEIGEGAWPAAGDLGGAEALLHEGERGVGEGGQPAFGVVEKSGAELVGESVNAVRCSGFLTHEAAPAAVEFAQVMVDRVRSIRVSGAAGTAGEQGLGDAEQVQGVGARDEIFAVLFGFVCADTDDDIALLAKRGGEVGDIRGFVLATEKDLVLGNLAAAGGGRHLLDQEVDAGGVVLHRKGGFENVAVAVTDQRDVLALGVVEGDAEDLAGVPGAFENRPDERVLISIDR